MPAPLPVVGGVGARINTFLLSSLAARLLCVGLLLRCNAFLCSQFFRDHFLRAGTGLPAGRSRSGGFAGSALAPLAALASIAVTTLFKITPTTALVVAAAAAAASATSPANALASSAARFPATTTVSCALVLMLLLLISLPPWPSPGDFSEDMLILFPDIRSQFKTTERYAPDTVRCDQFARGLTLYARIKQQRWGL